MKLFFSVIFLFHFCVLQAQTNNSYLKDLEALHSILKKTPSFKDQITGQTLITYNELYEKLKADSVIDINDYKYFYNLAQLFWPIRDNHMAFSHYIDETKYKDKGSFEAYLTTDEFKNFHRVNYDIDSLKVQLAGKDINTVEGIYNLDSSFSVGIFKVTDKEYVGVVLNSKINFYHHPLWTNGQIAIHLYENSPNHFIAFYADPISKGWILQPNEKYLNSSLINTNLFGTYYKKKYSKHFGQTDFVNLNANHPKFAIKSITDDIQYLLISTFQRNSVTSKESQVFYDSIKIKLTASYLVLDLRNNQGGAKSEAKKYYKLLRKYSKKGKLFVLMNNETLSQAEILILRLKKIKNVFLLGQTTKGMLAYGINMDNHTKLPSGKYIVSPTDMQGSKKLLKYENYGIKPEIVLNTNTDWITQTLEIIKTK